MTRLFTAAATCAGVLLFTAGPSFAQAGSLSPETLSRLRARDRVTVDIGTETVQGRLVEMAADSLVVATDAGPRRIGAPEIDRIDRRRKGVLLGTLIGLAAGVAAALPMRELLHNEGHDATTAVLALVGGGTAVGFAIDYAVDLPRTVYTREGRVEFHIEPSPLPGGATVRLHARF